MTYIEKANRLLRQTEKRLGQLAGEAVGDGRYDEAVTLTVLTKAVAELIGDPVAAGTNTPETATDI